MGDKFVRKVHTFRNSPSFETGLAEDLHQTHLSRASKCRTKIGETMGIWSLAKLKTPAIGAVEDEEKVMSIAATERSLRTQATALTKMRPSVEEQQFSQGYL